MNETGLPHLFEKMLLRCRENVNMEIKYLECFPSLVKINLILMVRSKKPGISRLYNCWDGWKVSAKLRRRYILATHLLLLLLSSDGGASKHVNRGSVLRAGSAAVGVGKHGHKGELGFMGKCLYIRSLPEEPHLA